MQQPGIYSIKYLVKIDGTTEVLESNFEPGKPKPQREKASLKELWQDALPFSELLKELERNGYYNQEENKLLMKAKDVRHLYNYLADIGAIERVHLDEMTLVYRAFANTFEMKFSSARALQHNLDKRLEQNPMNEILSLFRSPSTKGDLLGD
jgi:hypothetical protein